MSKEYGLDEPLIERTPELNLSLVIVFIILFFAIIYGYIYIQFLSCIALSTIFSIWFFLPPAVKNIAVTQSFPSELQNGLWAANFTEIKIKSKNHRFQKLLYKDITSSDTEVHIENIAFQCRYSEDQKKFIVKARILPLSQGNLKMSGFKLISKSGLGLFRWSIFIPAKHNMLAHTKDITLNKLELFDQYNINQHANPIKSTHSINGEDLNWPRNYEPGDQISKISWQKIATNPFEPIVFTSILPEKPQVVVIIDLYLKKKIIGDRDKMVQLCEYSKAFVREFLNNNFDINVYLYANQYNAFNLNNPNDHQYFHFALANSKTSNSNDKRNTLAQEIKSKGIFSIQLKLDKEETVIASICDQSFNLDDLYSFANNPDD
jgi:hypothetical protein